MFESMYRILTLIDSPTRCLGLSTATNHVQYCTSIHRDLKAVSQLHVPSPQSCNRRNRQVNASQCSAHWLSLSHTTARSCASSPVPRPQVHLPTLPAATAPKLKQVLLCLFYVFVQNRPIPTRTPQDTLYQIRLSRAGGTVREFGLHLC